MKQHLTLTIKSDVIAKAKFYAQSTDRSLSEMVESYLEYITKESISKEMLSPRLRKVVGVIKLPEEFNEI